jgi:hypothetical protein
MPREHKWRERAKPPDGLDPERLRDAIDALPEPDPDLLYEASQNPGHPLHAELWGIEDAVWADRGRRARCLELMESLVEVIEVVTTTRQEQPINIKRRRA